MASKAASEAATKVVRQGKPYLEHVGTPFDPEGRFSKFAEVIGFDPRKLFLLSAAIFLVIGLSTLFITGTGDSGDSVLFSGITDSDVSQITNALDVASIDYQFTAGTLTVPKDELARARLAVARAGAAPDNSAPGFSIFDRENSFTSSNFANDVRYQRAIEGELKNTIQEMSSVRSARVHVVFPKTSTFSSKVVKPTASVLITPRQRNGSLDREEVLAIQNLVASSVRYMKIGDVKVVSSGGKVLSGAADTPSARSMASVTASEFDRSRMLEEKIVSLLEPLVGRGQVIAKINVDLSSESSATKQVKYNPDDKIIRSEVSVNEKRRNDEATPEGVPGEKAAIGDQKSKKNTESADRDQISRTYEVSHEETSSKKPAGMLRSITASVVVGYQVKKEGADPEPRSQTELDKIDLIVKNAVGYKESRGDRVEVVSMPIQSGQYQLMGSQETGFMGISIDSEELYFRIARYSLVAIIALVLFIIVVRPMLKGLKQAAPPEEEPEEEELASDVKLGSEFNVSAEARIMEKTVEAASSMAHEDPVRTAAIIRSWMEESRRRGRR